ncbi:MAG: hypothetical protein H0T51_23275 [Pirellulales bacterium]|nr:hypothetical protein [Pirellulales bacterium]
MPFPKRVSDAQKIAAVIDEEVDRILAACEISADGDSDVRRRLVDCFAKKISSPSMAKRPAQIRLEMSAWPLRIVGKTFADLPPARALELLEAQGIDTLARRVDAAEEIARPAAPFYTSAELHSHITAFACSASPQVRHSSS